MPLNQFSEPILTCDELVAMVGIPSALSLKKELKALDVHMRRFIAHAPFLVLSTHATDRKSVV